MISAKKTRRGPARTRSSRAASGGGNSYGYQVVNRTCPQTGDAIHGERAILDDEARIVRRIFEEYASGVSPRADREVASTQRALKVHAVPAWAAFDDQWQQDPWHRHTQTTSFTSDALSGTVCAMSRNPRNTQADLAGEPAGRMGDHRCPRICASFPTSSGKP